MSIGPIPVIVAHRAGNRPDTAAMEAGRADYIELDLHVFRGRVEVRHEKVLRPTARLWDKWFLLPPGVEVPVIEEILAAVAPDTPLMLDLKCFTRTAARRIRAAVPGTHPLIVSSRAWWVLPVFADRADTSLLRSCGNRLQLWLVDRLPGLGPSVGAGVHERRLDDAQLARLRTKTGLLFSWGVKSRARGDQLVLAGVTGLIVDDVNPWFDLVQQRVQQRPIQPGPDDVETAENDPQTPA